VDLDEELSLSFEKDLIDIYSNSWGPGGFGVFVGGPEHLTKLALENGAREGRNGKGSIYVFSNGNGGTFGDDCATNGFVSSIYTISVGAIGVNGSSSPFDEHCPGKMVVAYVTDLEGKASVIRFRGNKRSCSDGIRSHCSST
jgi:furin